MIRSRSGKTVARSLLIGALALMISAATAGCEAGLNAPTLEYHAASSGASVVVNGIKITNAFVLGAPTGSTIPAGSDAGMFLSVLNGGSGSDALVSVDAPGYASSVQLSSGPVSLPVNSPVNLTGPQPEVVLSGLTKTLTGGQNIPVTLNFQHAGSVTVELPVQPQSFYYSTFSPPASPAATTAPTGTATPGAPGTASPTATATPSP